MCDGDIKYGAHLVGTPAPGCLGKGSTHHLNLLVPGGSSGKNTWLLGRWRGHCCHLHWYCLKSRHYWHHHMAHPLSPRKAWHHQAHLFLHHSLRHHHILGAEPEDGLVKKGIGSTKMDICSNTCVLHLNFVLKCQMCYVLYLGEVEAPLGALKVGDAKVWILRSP